ncbi:MAG: ABC transporter permease [Verrucomicrobia bacterium]|nr:ABC transporter permease [Verrucomicrobiota bacterium]
MTAFFAKRLLSLALTLFTASVAVFLIIHLVPGDPVSLLMKNPTPEKVAEARARLMLDRPLPVQYAAFVRNLVVDRSLGRSIVTTREVMEDLARSWAATAELAIAAMLFGIVAGLALGVWMAARRGQWPDFAGNVVSLLGLSIPVFWLGLVGMLVFSLWLGWCPAGDRLGADADFEPLTGLLLLDSLLQWRLDVFADALEHLALPALTLGAIPAAFIARTTRAAVVEALDQDFVRTARAKGVPEAGVLFHHALRAAMGPVATIAGLEFAYLLGGAVLTETVFSWPGLGRYVANAVLARDYPAIQGALLALVFAVVLVNLAMDVVHRLADPRLSKLTT